MNPLSPIRKFLDQNKVELGYLVLPPQKTKEENGVQYIISSQADFLNLTARVSVIYNSTVERVASKGKVVLINSRVNKIDFRKKLVIFDIHWNFAGKTFELRPSLHIPKVNSKSEKIIVFSYDLDFGQEDINKIKAQIPMDAESVLFDNVKAGRINLQNIFSSEMEILVQNGSIIEELTMPQRFSLAVDSSSEVKKITYL